MTLWNKTRGTTMVEVIVAFTVLVLIIGIFSQAMGMAGRMLNRSDDTLMNNRELAGQYYLGEADQESSVKTVFEFVDQENHASFTLDGYLVKYNGTDVNGVRAEGSVYAVEGDTEPASEGAADQP